MVGTFSFTCKCIPLFKYSIQNSDLRRKYGRTGAEKVPDNAKLTRLEELVLGYAGEESVSGEHSTLT